MSDPRLHFRKPLLTSPFHARTSALNKLNEWGPWGGYTTVLAYDDASMEYTAIRNQASVYDLSPMVKYRITGKDAVAYLDRVMIRNMASSKSAMSTTPPGATMRASFSMTAPCSGMAKPISCCAARSGICHGCSTAPSAMMFRSTRSPKRSRRFPCKAPAPLPC